MFYSIPKNKLEKLNKIIKRYNKKGANIKFEIGEEVIEDGTLYVNIADEHKSVSYPIKVECVRVFVEGTYRINGWNFVGTIEFTENGNIIRLADYSYEGKVPAKYLHTPKICEHCGKVRNRKDTYLICSDEGEWKQVGSSCLLDFTNGLDADQCADIMSVFDKVLNLASLQFSGEEFFGNGYSETYCGLDKDIKNYAIALVKQYGYQKMFNGEGTANDLSTFYFNRYGTKFESLEPVSDDEVAILDKYAQDTLELENIGLRTGVGYSEYLRNASLAWLKMDIEYRDFGLICSFVNTYIKEQNQKKLQELREKDVTNAWVGNVGDRITIKVSSTRVLFESTITVAWHTYATQITYEIKDTEGHTYIWKSSKNIKAKEEDDGTINFQAEPKEIVATVKEHSIYKGIKQTRITNGKVSY